MKYFKFSLLVLACLAVFSIDVVHAQNESTYRLGSGDKVRVSVFGEPDLSGEFEVDGSGSISLPLIGEIYVQGMSIGDVSEAVESELLQGYLVNPQVSVEVLNYRPFFILGEVNAPGSYAYVNGLTVLNAVALAGGYTPRARKSEIELQRGESKLEVEEYTQVLPGDVIVIKERLF